jgi:uncharacterized membrane protein (DUF485 family)
VIAHLSEPAKHWLDAAVVGGFVVAGISLAQAALVVTLIAGMISIALGMIRIHDRLKYGRGE